MSGSREGFDSPVGTVEDDLLGRWGFAHEIFTLATQCPDEWSVRIGVYGDWGTGKTSVLKFVEKMAQGKGHTVMWFNPWGVKKPDNLWRDFIKEVVGVIAPSALGPDASAVKRSELARRAVEAVLGVGKLFSETEKIAEAGSGLVANWLKAGPEDLKSISEYFRGHRLIVLIDDLDRADPSIVPEILFVLKEIFDLPGFSFVMGFDRQRVGAALADYHPGWGRGIEFLDKVVDFPRWLPTPSVSSLRRLAVKDLQKYASFVDLEAYHQVEKHAPVNPRELRKFARGLIGFGKEVGRYGEGEIDWPLFLLIAFFRVRWPMVFESVFGFSALEKLFSATGRTPLEDSETADKSARDADKSARDAIEAHLRAAGMSESNEIPEASALLEDVFRKARAHSSPRKIFDMAFLLEFPKLATREEVERLVGEWLRGRSPSIVEDWIQRQAKDIQQPQQSIHAYLFDELLRFRDEVLHAAASAVRDEKTVEYGTFALELLGLLDVLSVELGGLVQTPHALEITHLSALIGQVVYWAHFQNHEIYLNLREAELRLLSRIAEKATIDVVAMFNVISGIDLNMVEGRKFVTKMRDVLLETLEPRVAHVLIGAFRQQHAIDSVVHNLENLAVKGLLLRAEGPFWVGRNRQTLSEMAAQAIEVPVIQENFFYLATTLKGDLERRVARSIGADGDALSIIWKGASARSVNPRMLTALQEVREQFEKSAGIKLPLPPWWPEGNSASRTGAPGESPAVPSGSTGK